MLDISTHSDKKRPGNLDGRKKKIEFCKKGGRKRKKNHKEKERKKKSPRLERQRGTGRYGRIALGRQREFAVKGREKKEAKHPRGNVA